MTKKYKHLSQEQRYQLQALMETKISKTAIAKIISVDRSTVNRELKRNVPKRGRGAKKYDAQNAHKKTQLRHHEKTKHFRFTDTMKSQIQSEMEQERLSPELIWAAANKKGTDMVSHETIYSWIWRMKHSNKRNDLPYKNLYKSLKHGKRHRKRGKRNDSRGIIPGRVCITKRPAIVEKRERTGDIEVDLMMGKNHKSALLVITDRATIKTRLRKLQGKDSNVIAKKIVESLSKEKQHIKTITFDNDMAFSQHQNIAILLNSKTYFTRPYTSQDKGTIENRIGVIRMFYPKKTDLNFVTHQQIKKVENAINNRPVRKFGYLSPNEKHQQMLKKAYQRC